MGWIVEILVSLVLFTNALVADVGCSGDKETCDNSLQAMMEGRGTRQKKEVEAYPVCDNGGQSQFCWWAIEVGNPRWVLYRNGMEPLIE
ncbi:hypothetical protein Tcan_05458 [Toxocara canis]|uniref:Thyroglobulin type-1 domain-containing protein n=1 Tax=Toxocara canis TaxID=6265 RepID=A0A0B2VC76_TOXCA|nr:hypothetical protein Tcan_05458 [Toxocara canis]